MVAGKRSYDCELFAGEVTPLVVHSETMSSSKSRPTRDIELGVKYAINHGYQVSPNAIRLMELVAQEKVNKGVIGPGFDSIIAALVEEKARLASSLEMNTASNTITEEDLVTLAPDVFKNNPSITSSESTATVQESDLQVVSDPSTLVHASGAEGFSLLFKSRYEKLVRILRERPEARQLRNISEIDMQKGTSKICGLVLSKRPMKAGVELVIDDLTGKASLLAMGEESKRAVNETILDQCVMVEVDGNKGRLLIKAITQPDLPLKVVGTSKKTAYAIFLSDLHVGSNKFLEGAFTRFLDWLNGKGLHEELDEEILRHLKYIVIGGDIVDGVGIFPNQEYELIESDIAKQYQMVAQKLSVIPKRFAMVAIPGNHDSTRQALPQPSIPRKYAEPLYGLDNLTMLGDPCVVKLSGVNVLIYHGRSLDDVLATTPGLSYEKPTQAMKVLLRARHLAPMFGSRTPIAPGIEDHLVIEQVPDIFHAGHVHSVGVEDYRGTLIINSGTWQAQTTYQANLGIMPRPGVVPIVNLATFELTFREFLTTKMSSLS